MICKNCANWSRSTGYDHDKGEYDLNIGVCSKVNYVSYYAGTEYSNAQIKDAQIGGDNISTSENFGCINFKVKEQ